jgi:MFS family permease
VKLIGLLGFAAAYLLFAVITQFGLSGMLTPMVAFVMLVAMRATAGFMMSGVPVAAQAFIADNTSASDRTAGIALLGAANSLGLIVGPALGAVLAGFGLLAPLYAAAVAPLLAVVLVATQLQHRAATITHKREPRLSQRDARIRPWLLIGFTIIVALIGVQVTVGFLFQDRLNLTAQQTAQTLGVALVAVGITNVIAQLGIIRTFKIPPLTLLRVGVPLAVIGFAILILADGLPLPYKVSAP